jgi:lipopolysaccharide transport system ATP-binding protein
MSEIAVHVEKLSKQYYIGGPQQAYPTFRDVVTSAVTSPFRRTAALLRGHAYGAAALDEAIWALKDISFEVKRGEVVGIIGRNGAGKSTLLKILSRITEPTEGYAEIRGRVGSLLEVGTGFHPELTGRENVFLNGSILGMKRQEIKRRFDEIVEFSGVEKFIDTPVKHYSSGMQVRLAFAVAAYLEPEILIVDEVLAVGDAEFQKKCLGKMSDVTSEGRTVLFVSHNMQAVTNLCQKAILLQNGQITHYTDTRTVVDTYLESGQHGELNTDITPEMHQKYPPGLEIFRVEFLNRNGELTNTLLIDEPFSIRIFYRIHQPELSYRIGVIFRSKKNDIWLAVLVCNEDGLPPLQGKRGETFYITVQTRNKFMPGEYHVDFNVKAESQKIDYIEGFSFTVEPSSIETVRTYMGGIIKLDSQWIPPKLQIDCKEI